MHTVLLVIQMIIAVSLIGVILIQRSSSDGLSGLGGGGGGGGGSFLSGRASANLLTRLTTILAALFMLNSMTLATLSARDTSTKKSLMDSEVSGAPADKTKTEQKPVAPSVPVAQ